MFVIHCAAFFRVLYVRVVEYEVRSIRNSFVVQESKRPKLELVRSFIFLVGIGMSLRAPGLLVFSKKVCAFAQRFRCFDSHRRCVHSCCCCVLLMGRKKVKGANKQSRAKQNDERERRRRHLQQFLFIPTSIEQGAEQERTSPR